MRGLSVRSFCKSWQVSLGFGDLKEQGQLKQNCNRNGRVRKEWESMIRIFEGKERQLEREGNTKLKEKLYLLISGGET